MQATPRLSEDKVKQCVDPKLRGEYPPKGVAKVCSCVCVCVFFVMVIVPDGTIWRKAGFVSFAQVSCGSLDTD